MTGHVYAIVKYCTLDGPSSDCGSGYQDHTALVRVDLPHEQYHNPPSYDLYATAARLALTAFDRYSFSKKFNDKTRPRNALVAGVFDAGLQIERLFPKDVKRLEAVPNVRKLK